MSLITIDYGSISGGGKKCVSDTLPNPITTATTVDIQLGFKPKFFVVVIGSQEYIYNEFNPEDSGRFRYLGLETTGQGEYKLGDNRGNTGITAIEDGYITIKTFTNASRKVNYFAME